MTARSDWEAQRHSNEILPPWKVATLGERLVKLVCWFASPFIVGAMFIGLMTVFGMMIEGVAQRSEDHDRCMKHATNGYEIERCR